jgi:hypothetical protein
VKYRGQGCLPASATSLLLLLLLLLMLLMPLLMLMLLGLDVLRCLLLVGWGGLGCGIST